MNSKVKGIGWVLALATLFAQSGTPGYLVYAQSTQAKLEATIVQLENLFDALEAASKDIPRETFDLEAALMLTDLTAEGVFEWVRDNTYLVPYEGALRGPQGVLMDRVGNSLDRALLLQGLLQLLGYDTRLARAQLSEEQALNILSKTRSIPAEGAVPQPQPIGADINTELQKYAKEFGLDWKRVAKVVAQFNEQRDIFDAKMEARVKSQTAFLYEALGSPIATIDAERAKQVAAAQDHWWVEYSEGGVWFGLDPTLPNAALGQKIFPASKMLLINNADVGLPKDLLHTLQIKVVLECALDSGLKEITLVESPPLISTNLLGQRIAINHVPESTFQNIDTEDSKALRDAILAQDRWFPVLTIGSQQIFTNNYTSSCDIGTATLPQPGEEIGRALKNTLDEFNNIQAMNNTRERITAQWIEYTVSLPGKPDQVVRRQLFDLVGPAARATQRLKKSYSSRAQKLEWRLALLGGTEIVPLANWLSSEYINAITTRNDLNNFRLFFNTLQTTNISDGLEEAAHQIKLLPASVFALILERQNYGAKNIYLEQLNILSYHTQQRLHPQGHFMPVAAFDIVINDVAISFKEQNVFRTRLMQGVVDTNAEALLAGGICTGSGVDRCQYQRNASELFEAAHRQGIPWLTVRAADSLHAVNVSTDVLAHLQRDLANNNFILMPKEPVLFGNTAASSWWKIDMESGQTLGMIDNGWGGQLVEYLNALRLPLNVGFTMGCIAGVIHSKVSDTGKAVASLLCIAKGGRKGYDILKMGISGDFSTFILKGIVDQVLIDGGLAAVPWLF